MASVERGGGKEGGKEESWGGGRKHGALFSPFPFRIFLSE